MLSERSSLFNDSRKHCIWRHASKLQKYLAAGQEKVVGGLAKQQMTSGITQVDCQATKAGQCLQPLSTSSAVASSPSLATLPEKVKSQGIYTFPTIEYVRKREMNRVPATLQSPSAVDK